MWLAGRSAADASAESDAGKRRVAARTRGEDAIFVLRVAVGGEDRGACVVRHGVHRVDRPGEDVAKPVSIAVRLELAREASPFAEHVFDDGNTADDAREDGQALDGGLG